MNEWMFGIHPIKVLLTTNPQHLIEVFVNQDRQDSRLLSLLIELKQQGISVQRVSKDWLSKKACGAVHQGILAKVKRMPVYIEKDLEKILSNCKTAPFLLILDKITDPHNFGACLRSADAAGVHAVIVPRNRAASLTPAAKKVASGAAEIIPIIKVSNLVHTLKWLKSSGIWIIGTDRFAKKDLFCMDKMNDPLALIMGNEEKGMSRLTREQCDEQVRIPQMGTISSLNVSVAAGIFLFEVVRQRFFKSS